MGTKMVRIDEDLYERIKSKKREGETFSEAIERLTSEYTLMDFADEFADEDGNRWDEHKEAIETAETAQHEEMTEFHEGDTERSPTKK
ncbi:MAG: antitoxin VapB family protein [Halobacteriales archaeon]|nr:antitoxin VapB family protein [Halobacteriales archaeon]